MDGFCQTKYRPITYAERIFRIARDADMYFLSIPIYEEIMVTKSYASTPFVKNCVPVYIYIYLCMRVNIRICKLTLDRQDR